MDFFFFGSLMDDDVARLVLGRSVVARDRLPARAEGFRRALLAGESYPVLLPRPGGHVDGVLTRGVTAAEHARIAWFEDGEYDLAEIPVAVASGERVPAWVCLRRAGTAVNPDSEWSFARWQVEDKASFLELARGWMDLMGRATIAEAEAAWQALKAAQHAPITRLRRN